MDPEEAFRALNRAIRDRDREEAKRMLEGLYFWLNTGGFMPDPDQVVGCYERPIPA